MPDNEFFYTGVQRALRGLKSCGMMTLGSLVRQLSRVCRLVIEQIHSFHPGRQFRERSRVTALGERAGNVRPVAQFLERKHLGGAVRIFTNHILATLDRTDFGE